MNASDRIIINTANLKKGGSLQVALSFIKEAGKQPQEFHIFLGRASMPLVTEEMRQYPNCTFYDIDMVPTDSLGSLKRFRRELDRLEKKIAPKAVITVFGPCYWKPVSPHIMGFANGYLLYEDSPFFKLWNGHKSIPYKLKKLYHRYLLRKETDHYWIETEDAKQRLAAFLGKPATAITVASNNCSDYFYDSHYESFDGLPERRKFRFVYIAAYYPHKNIEIIPGVLAQLEALKVEAEFVITISQEEYDRHTQLHHPAIINIGPVHPKYCPALYQSADAVFMPSMLETFSAVYPEAMYMGKPIVTSDLSFAKDICGDAALYYHFDSPSEAANKISELIADSSLRERLIANGKKRLTQFDRPDQRFAKILEKALHL